MIGAAWAESAAVDEMPRKEGETLKPGDWIEGGYRILRPLGSGGEGTVYLACREQTARFYAIKELDQREACFSPESVALWKRLRYPGIPEIADLQEQDGTLRIVMEYVEGKTLSAWLFERGTPGLLQIADWGIDICGTLEYLHSQNPPVIYGDLKPDNIIIQRGKPVLTDLGSAVLRGSRGKRTGTGAFALEYDVGTQDGREMEEDLYSFGMLLKELLKGQTNRNGKTIRALAEMLTAVGEKTAEGSQDKGRKYLRFFREKGKCRDGRKIRDIGQCRRELERYRKKPRQWMGALLLSLSLVFLAGVNCGGELRHRQRESRYAAGLEEAKGREGKMRTETLEAVIMLCPERQEAYQELLQTFLEDLTFDGEEEFHFRQILKGVPEGTNRTCESLLRENLSGYLEVACEIGTAYWYFYEGMEGKSRAADWFAKACAVPETAAEDPSLRERSSIYAQLGTCRQRLEQEAVVGSDMSVFLDYWDSMQCLMESWRDDSWESAVRLRFWQEYLTELLHYTAEFAEAGVTKKKMEETLQKMKTELEQYESARTQIQTLRTELLQSADELEDRIERTYRRRL